ncbi:MAG: putative Ig domain-containing protein, partial [Chthoniobacterales bacterium]
STYTAVSTSAADLTSTSMLVTDPSTGNAIVINELTSALAYADAEIDSTNKAVIVGSFQSYLSGTSKGIVRVTSTGAVDTSFNPGTGVEWRTTAETPSFHPLADNIETQGNGELIVTGTFEGFNGVVAPGIVRLHRNGSVDSSFVAPASRAKNDLTPTYFKRQFDGSFLLSGPYTSANRDVSPSFLHFFGPPLINSPLTASTTIGRPFFYQFEAPGATSLSVVGLPNGLSFDPALATIVGTTNQAPTNVPVTLSASNAYGTTTATLMLTIVPSPASGPIITSSTSATGRTGAPFRFQVITTGGSAATKLSVTNLPAGLSFDPVSGVISGTPQSAASTAVTLNVTDPSGKATGILQLTFSGDVGLPVIVSPDSALLTSGKAFSYTINAPVTTGPDDNTTYSLVGTLPIGLFFDEKTGVISGSYQGSPIRDGTLEARALSGGIISNVQLFATNSHGTATIPLVFFNAPTGSVNISTRLDVGTADNVLIGGFIVTGNAPKKLLIRAIGPSMKAGGHPLAGALQDTTLDLYQGTTLLGSNDDWRSNQEQEIEDSGVPPSDDRESAIVATLAPQTGYTAIVRGKGGNAGIGLAEIYDLGTAGVDASTISHLANISTRGTVLTADNVMIGGFIISGVHTKVLARAIGPSLTSQGVAGALQDPMLELHDATGALVSSNDDWRAAQEQQIIQTTIPPTDNRESAIVATLQPGAYTAVVRGKNDSTGVALVEIYSLQ